MATTIMFKNNFAHYKEQFKDDTGLDYNSENLPLYLAYLNARLADDHMQLTIEVITSVDALGSKLDSLRKTLKK